MHGYIHVNMISNKPFGWKLCRGIQQSVLREVEERRSRSADGGRERWRLWEMEGRRDGDSGRWSEGEMEIVGDGGRERWKEERGIEREWWRDGEKRRGEKG